jgi:hypothetical protein
LLRDSRCVSTIEESKTEVFKKQSMMTLWIKQWKL